MKERFECLEMKKLLKEILEWKDSTEVRSAFSSAWIHGHRVSGEFCNKVDAMWKKAELLSKEAE